MSLLGKKIAVGIAGGIAAYKACELVRAYKKAGAEVRVVMTPAAQRFVSEITFASLSENPIGTSLFDGLESSGIAHIDIARWCDVFVICPATANVIARIAGGIADDLLTTSILATESEVLICPAMNSGMWQKAAVQENLDKLKKWGYEILDPEWGELATSSEGQGWGRLPVVESIYAKTERLLLATSELVGKKIVVSAGPTREALDSVRFFTNFSTGKMGFALAEAAVLKGAEVVLVAGPNNLRPPQGVKYVEVVSAEEMFNAIQSEYADCDVLLMAAAVADYRPDSFSQQKIKKKPGDLNLSLKRNPDILVELAKKKSSQIHVGFALETQDLVKNASKKLESKKLDLIIANNPLNEGSAFAGDTNVVTMISAAGQIESLPKMPKTEVAIVVLEQVKQMLDVKNASRVAI